MSLRRQLGVSLLVQGAGSAALLLATLWLGAKLGPEQQGVFSHTKAEIEFIAAFAMFGLPQALFYFVKLSRLGRGAALRWAAGSGLLALAIGAVCAAVQHPRSGAFAVAALAIAVALSVFHGQLRSLLLVGQRTEWFNLATAWPQLVVLLGVLVLVALGAASEPRWPWLFALAFGSAAVLALWRLRAAPGAPATAPEAGWRELGHYGLAAWLTAALSTAAVLLVQRWVGHGQGAAVLGVFTMAMTLVQLPLTPVNYAAPLLFRRWMERPGARASQRWAAVLFAALLGVAVLVWLAAPLWPRLGLGPGYAGLAQALAVLLVGGAAEAASRVLGVNANAVGTPWVAARAETARWAVLGVGWLAPLPAGLLPMCALWSAAALAAAAVFAFQSRGATPWPEAAA
ncbi:MAG: hypothetical protein ABL916_01755 [Burkholderiaceae bacterium]